MGHGGQAVGRHRLGVFVVEVRLENRRLDVQVVDELGVLEDCGFVRLQLRADALELALERELGRPRNDSREQAPMGRRCSGGSRKRAGVFGTGLVVPAHRKLCSLI